MLSTDFPIPSNMTANSCLCSDHVPVIFDVADIPHQVVKDFASADWRRFSTSIAARWAGMDVVGSMVSAESIDKMVDLLTEAIQEADRSCIPRMRRQFGIFGLTPEVMALIGE